MRFWEKIETLNGFSLKIRTFDSIGAEARALIKSLVNTAQINDTCQRFGLNLTSRCEDALLWTAPEFVYKTFIQCPSDEKLEKTENLRTFLFDFEHIYCQRMDRGLSSFDFDSILTDFISKYPTIELTSLHIKVFSWTNLSDSSFAILRKLLGLYARSLEDLQLLFSG